MKKTFYLLCISLLTVSCGIFRTIDIANVSLGMSKREVKEILGPPVRILATTKISEGYEEILQYRTSYAEIYALEFKNDCLVGYEFLYEDVLQTLPPVVEPSPIYMPQPVPLPNHPAPLPKAPAEVKPPAKMEPINRLPVTRQPQKGSGTNTVRPGTTIKGEGSRPVTRPAQGNKRTRSENSGSNRRSAGV